MSSNNIYYVYAYIRSKDSKTANAGTPYYIGKGTGRRMVERHLVSIPKDKKFIVIIESNLTNVGALALERRMVRWYGRQDLNTGILRNRTDGGDGTSSAVRPKELVEKIAQANRGKKRSIQQRENISRSKQNLSDETIDKMRKSALNRPNEHRKKIGALRRKPCCGPDGLVFGSPLEAAKYYGWKKERVYASIRRGVSGWKYLD